MFILPHFRYMKTRQIPPHVKNGVKSMIHFINKWPLYKCCSAGEEDNDDDDLVGNFMHRYFDGDLMIKSNPLLAQLPNHVIDSLWEKIIPLTTIHVPLFRDRSTTIIMMDIIHLCIKKTSLPLKMPPLFVVGDFTQCVRVNKSNCDKFHLKNTQEQ